MFDGFEMKAALRGVALSLASASVASATVIEPESPLSWVLATAVFCGCLGIVAWHRSPWLGGVAAVMSWIFVWVSAIDLDSPARLPEASSDYIKQVYLILGLCALLHLLGVVAHIRKRNSERTQGKLA